MAGWEDSTELFVGKSGGVYFAPVGTALPAIGSDPATTALNSAFTGAGYLSEDGVSFTSGGEVVSYNVWQSLQAVRRERTSQDLGFTFTMVQWNENTLSLSLGGGTVTDHGGDVYSYAFPAPDAALDERSLVVEVLDGDNKARFVFQRGNVAENVEMAFQRGQLAGMPVTFDVLAPLAGGSPGYITSNLPGFAAGS